MNTVGFDQFSPGSLEVLKAIYGHDSSNTYGELLSFAAYGHGASWYAFKVSDIDEYPYGTYGDLYYGIGFQVIPAGEECYGPLFYSSQEVACSHQIIPIVSLNTQYVLKIK